MIIYLQIPLCDLRLFHTAEEIGFAKLSKPTWPFPAPYLEFIKSFGAIKERPGGGLSTWIGENEICDSHNAFKFAKSLHFYDKSIGQLIKIICVSKYFFHDGLASARIEMIFVTKPNNIVYNSHNLYSLISSLLTSKIIIELPNHEKRICSLAKSGKQIALKYLYSSSKKPTSELVENKWIVAGSPILLIETKSDEIDQSTYSSNAPGYPKYNYLRIGSSTSRYFQTLLKGGSEYLPTTNIYSYYGLIKLSSFSIQMLIFIKNIRVKKENRTNSIGRLRTLRINLLRLNSEINSLMVVLYRINDGTLNPALGSNELQSLQLYLNNVTRKILMVHRTPKSDQLLIEFERLAHDIFNKNNPGLFEVILDKLHTARIRPQVLNKVRKFINQIYQINGDLKMNLNHTVKGINMPNAKIQTLNFYQLWNEAPTKIDLSKLADELCLLRNALKSAAKTVEHDQAIGAVASAEAAAQEDDGPKALQHLANAGKWAWGMAEKIGANIAAAAIKQSLDI